MATNSGRDPSGQALAVPVEPASSLAASRFDPSRGDKPKRAIVAKIEIEADDWTSVRRVLRQLEVDIVTRKGLGNVISGGYDSGYAICCEEDASITHEVWADNLDRYLAYIDARDSDRSGEASETPHGGSTVGESAGRQASPTQSGQE